MKRSVAIISTAVLLACCAAASGEIGYMRPFTDAELAGPHVTCRSYTVPQDFVDGQWEGIIAASDGKTYFSFSCHGPDQNAQFYRFDPAGGKIEHLIDVAKWCGDGDEIGKHNVQGKIHSQIYEIDGKLYCSSTTAHRPPEKPGRGGHFLSYDLKTGECKDLGLFPDPNGGLLTMYHEPVRGRLYAISQTKQTLCYYDLKTGKIVTIGSVADDDSAQTRMLISDEFGCVYGTCGDGMIWRYDPQSDSLGCLLTRIPHDPEAPQPDEGSWHAEWRHWHPIVWDPQSKWWYGVRTNDEYLFRLRLPESPKSHRGRAEGLAQFGLQPSKDQPRFASLALTVQDGKLYYCSYKWGPNPAHLMRYDIAARKVTDLGPIVVERGRAVTEIHSLVVGADAKLHAAAMVFSVKGEDPAKEWANRGNCYFHARFLVIDPKLDFRDQPAPNDVAAK